MTSDDRHRTGVSVSRHEQRSFAGRADSPRRNCEPVGGATLMALTTSSVDGDDHGTRGEGRWYFTRTATRRWIRVIKVVLKTRV